MSHHPRTPIDDLKHTVNRDAALASLYLGSKLDQIAREQAEQTHYARLQWWNSLTPQQQQTEWARVEAGKAAKESAGREAATRRRYEGQKIRPFWRYWWSRVSWFFLLFCIGLPTAAGVAFGPEVKRAWILILYSLLSVTVYFGPLRASARGRRASSERDFTAKYPSFAAFRSAMQSAGSERQPPKKVANMAMKASSPESAAANVSRAPAPPGVGPTASDGPYSPSTEHATEPFDPALAEEIEEWMSWHAYDFPADAVIDFYRRRYGRDVMRWNAEQEARSQTWQKAFYLSRPMWQMQARGQSRSKPATATPNGKRRLLTSGPELQGHEVASQIRPGGDAISSRPKTRADRHEALHRLHEAQRLCQGANPERQSVLAVEAVRPFVAELDISHLTTEEIDEVVRFLEAFDQYGSTERDAIARNLAERIGGSVRGFPIGISPTFALVGIWLASLPAHTPGLLRGTATPDVGTGANDRFERTMAAVDAVASQTVPDEEQLVTALRLWAEVIEQADAASIPSEGFATIPKLTQLAEGMPDGPVRDGATRLASAWQRALKKSTTAAVSSERHSRGPTTSSNRSSTPLLSAPHIAWCRCSSCQARRESS